MEKPRKTMCQSTQCARCRDGILPVSPEGCQTHQMTAEKLSTSTDSVTGVVTGDVTEDVTEDVTDGVTGVVTFYDTNKPVSTSCDSVRCECGSFEGVTLNVTLDVTFVVTSFVTANVTSKKEKNKKTKERRYSPCTPLRRKKIKKEKTTTQARVHARKIPAGKLEERCLQPHRSLGIFICLWRMLLYSKVDRFLPFKRFHAIESVYGVEEFGSFLHLWRILLCSPTP